MTERNELVVDGLAGLVPSGGGGIGRYLCDLAHALSTIPGAPPARLLIPRNLRGMARERYGTASLLEIPLAWRQFALAVLVGSRVGFRFDRMYGEPRVVHSPLGYGPRFRRARLINHIHDLTYLERPEWHTARIVSLMTLTAPIAVRAASVVLSHSNFVRDQVVEVFGVPRERTVVIPPPLGYDFQPIPRQEARERVLRRFGLEGDFLLHVGTLEPRKNHERLFEAFERLRLAGFPGPLILVGHDGWHMQRITARMAASPQARFIRRITDADDHDLVALYGACTMSVFPSLAEGFGMPLLESMACGAPCVASSHPALVELAGGCALTPSPTDVDALTDAMRRIWKSEELRERLGSAGRLRAADYVFPRWAERIFALYRRELAAAD